MTPETSSVVIRQIADLLDGYRAALRQGGVLHANDFGNDPERLRNAAEAWDLIAQERDALKKEVETWQECEARTCPEDFGFEEVVRSLRSRVAELETACRHQHAPAGDALSSRHPCPSRRPEQ